MYIYINVHILNTTKQNKNIYTYIYICMYRFWLVMDPDTREWLKRLFTAWSFLKNPIVEAIAFVSILVPQRAALPAVRGSAEKRKG